MTGPRVLVAEFTHESNMFVSGLTDRAAFADRLAVFGPAVLDELQDTNSELGGYLDVMSAAGADIVPAMAVSATPGPVIEREAFEYYWDKLANAIRDADPLDGIGLALHGAMALEDHHDGDGLILERVRELVGDDVPVVSTLDLHTNVTEAMAANADALVAYENYPHTDMYESGETAGAILLELIEEDIDIAWHIERPPMLTSGPSQNTSTSPMQDVMAAAREVESDDAIFKVNVTPGFFRADFPEVGFAVTTYARTNAAAKAATREVAAFAWDRHEEFVKTYPAPEAAVAEAADLIAAGETVDGPVVLGDVGDNPGGGAPGDETALLRQLLDQDISNAGVVMIHDPEVVDSCVDAGVRSTVTVDLGGKSPNTTTDPIRDLEAYVKTIADGRFENTGLMRTGVTEDTGRTVLLRCGASIWVIVTEIRKQPFDAELWRHVGIQPERLDCIVVKSANHYRADYDRIGSTVIPVDSPGSNPMDPRGYDYNEITRPIVPLDPAPDYPSWD